MKTHLLGAVCACLFNLVATSSNAVVVVQPLEGRLPATPGGTDYQAYYDPNLDISWAADANINGLDTWNNQLAWAASLDIGGVDGWRLPSADVNGDGTIVDCAFGGVIGCTDNEMGYLYWEEGIRSFSPGVFSNVQSNVYWFSTEFASHPIRAWFFLFNTDGFQSVGDKSFNHSAWAVHSGDVGVVPAAVWLLGSGLVGLLGVAKRKR